MRGPQFRRLTAVALLFLTIAVGVAAGEVISVMRNVNAVPEHQGYRINPAYDAAEAMGSEDLAPVQAFEILRPQGKPVTIGRLYTSCTCIRLESPRRSFGPDERAILQLRNITPTPMNGQVYAIYVQITSPVHTTLRFDTFVQSNSAILTAEDRAAAAGRQPQMQPANPNIEGVINPPIDPDIEIIVPKSATEIAEDETNETIDDTAEAEKEDAPSGETAEDQAATGAAPTHTDDAKDNELDAMDAFFAREEPLTKSAAESVDPAMPDLLPPARAASTQSESPAMTIPLPPPSDTERRPADVSISLAPPVSATPEPRGEIAPAANTTVAPSSPVSAAPSAARKTMRSVSLITIGVRDMSRAISFYEALGWRRAARNKYDQTAFFQLDGQVIALYPMQDLVKEQNMGSAIPAPGGITLAIHVENRDDVKEMYRNFLDAGGSSLKAPTEMPSGAVTCYVADPDGNPWEISWVPQFRLDKDGKLWLP